MYKKYVPVLLGLLLIQACASTSNGLKVSPKKPHVYKNTYEDVIDATDQAIQKAKLNVRYAEKNEKGDYIIECYRKDYLGGTRAQSQSAVITIHKVDKQTTQVTIDEPSPPVTVTQSYRHDLAPLIFEKLDPMLNLQVD